jgi:PPOX class probable F420-dependent enzyme
MPNAIAQFASAKYLNLETFRKSGIGVCTPVWFAPAPAESGAVSAPEVFYVYSEADAGKVKRIRNNLKVRVAPCDMRGNLRGAWVDGRARICAGEETARAQQLLRRKYGWLKVVGDFFSRLIGHQQVVIAIELA